MHDHPGLQARYCLPRPFGGRFRNDHRHGDTKLPSCIGHSNAGIAVWRTDGALDPSTGMFLAGQADAA